MSRLAVLLFGVTGGSIKEIKLQSISRLKPPRKRRKILKLMVKSHLKLSWKN